MSGARAWATILGGLVLSTLATLYLVRGAAPVLQLSPACLILNEAEKAGYIDATKRADLAAKVAASAALSAKERQIASELASACPKGL